MLMDRMESICSERFTRLLTIKADRAEVKAFVDYTVKQQMSTVVEMLDLFQQQIVALAQEVEGLKQRTPGYDAAHVATPRAAEGQLQQRHCADDSASWGSPRSYPRQPPRSTTAPGSSCSSPSAASTGGFSGAAGRPSSSIHADATGVAASCTAASVPQAAGAPRAHPAGRRVGTPAGAAHSLGRHESGLAGGRPPAQHGTEQATSSTHEDGRRAAQQAAAAGAGAQEAAACTGSGGGGGRARATACADPGSSGGADCCGREAGARTSALQRLEERLGAAAACAAREEGPRAVQQLRECAVSDWVAATAAPPSFAAVGCGSEADADEELIVWRGCVRPPPVPAPGPPVHHATLPQRDAATECASSDMRSSAPVGQRERAPEPEAASRAPSPERSPPAAAAAAAAAGAASMYVSLASRPAPCAASTSVRTIPSARPQPSAAGATRQAAVARRTSDTGHTWGPARALDDVMQVHDTGQAASAPQPNASGLSWPQPHAPGPGSCSGRSCSTSSSRRSAAESEGGSPSPPSTPPTVHALEALLEAVERVLRAQPLQR